jgi:hypothetical protein
MKTERESCNHLAATIRINVSDGRSIELIPAKPPVGRESIQNRDELSFVCWLDQVRRLMGNDVFEALRRLHGQFRA